MSVFAFCFLAVLIFLFQKTLFLGKIIDIVPIATSPFMTLFQKTGETTELDEMSFIRDKKS